MIHRSFRRRLFQIVAGYEDANDANRQRHDPALQIIAIRKLGETLGSQPTLSRWENAPSARDLVRLNDVLLDQFVRLCGEQVRQCGEILLASTRPMILRMASNNSASLTAPTASPCFLRC